MRSLIILTGINLFSWGSSYIIHILAGKTLPASSYGVFGVALAVLSLTELIFISGVPYTVSKYISGERQEKKIILREGLRLMLFIFGPLSFALLVTVKLWSRFLKGDYSVYAILVVMLPLLAFRAVYYGYENGLKNYLRQSSITGVSVLTKLILATLFLWLGFEVEGLFLAFLLSVLVGLAYATQLDGFGEQGFLDQLQFLKETAYVTGIGLVVPAALNVLPLIASFFVSGDELGFFTASSMLGRIPFLLSSGIVPLIFPELSRLVVKKSSDQVGKIISRVVRFILILFIPILVVLSLNARLWLGLLYRPEYEVASKYLILVGIAYTLLVLIRIFATVFSAYTKTKRRLLLNLFIPIVLVCLATVGAIGWGLSGLAYGFLIGCGLVVMFYLILLRQELQLPIVWGWKQLLIIIISNLVLVFFFLKMEHLVSSKYLYLFLQIVGYLIYLGIIFMSGMINLQVPSLGLKKLND